MRRAAFCALWNAMSGIVDILDDDENKILCGW